jgi:hypothetical protein
MKEAAPAESFALKISAGVDKTSMHVVVSSRMRIAAPEQINRTRRD